jgi:hypothetical protein
MGSFLFEFVGTNLQCADFLTKGVSREKLEGFCIDVGLYQGSIEEEAISKKKVSFEEEDLDRFEKI